MSKFYGFNDMQPIAEQEIERDMEKAHAQAKHLQWVDAMVNKPPKSDFDSAEDAIIRLLKGNFMVQEYGRFNPWFNKLPVEQQAYLLTKYPAYAALIETKSKNGISAAKRKEFWYKMHKVQYGE